MFDVRQTVISQYGNSPVLLALIDNLAGYFDGDALSDLFYNLIWNIDTATGYGLDVLGRIVGVDRTLPIDDYGTDYRLSDNAYRQVIRAKAASNVSDGSIPHVNAALLTLFGQGYVIDNRDMTMVYRFPAALNAVQRAIVQQGNIIPKPAGVSFTIVEGP